MGGKLVFHIKGKQYAILNQNVQKSKYLMLKKSYPGIRRRSRLARLQPGECKYANPNFSKPACISGYFGRFDHQPLEQYVAFLNQVQLKSEYNL